MRQDDSHWRTGALLALTTAMIWGMLPLGLEVALTELDPWSLVWWRFTGAAVIFGLWLHARGQLPSPRTFTRRTWIWLGIAVFGLTSNYVTFVIGMQLTSPAVAQLVIQVAPLILLAAGVLAFGERLSAAQSLGVALLVGGLLLFFNRRLPELLQTSTRLGLGVLLIVAGAIGWALYGVAQRHTSRQLGSLQTLWLLCIGCAIVVTPLAHPLELQHASPPALVAVAFCVLNTVFGYGSFGLALERWQVSRVTALTALAPLLTLLFVWLSVHAGLGWVRPEPLNALSWAGALLVVGGSALAALAARRR
jgi:drug/metabolite transporter (DMT)-like permease